MEITTSFKDLCSRTVGEIVAEDYRRASVFEKYGIDFCCGGNKTIKEACEARNISCDTIVSALIAVEEGPSQSPYVDVRSWEPDFLAAYIVNVHHQYVRERLQPLRQITRTVARVHGDAHPETVKIADLVDEMAIELEQHLEAEERVLFPYIERLCAARKNGAPVADVQFDSVHQPVQLMEDEHDHVGEILHRIRVLSRDYELPEDACNTYRFAYARLEEFEADMHRHVHLENNILFPAAIRLEREIA